MRMIGRILLGWVLAIFIGVLYFQPWSWAWRPRTNLGWIIVLIVIVPVMAVVGESLSHVVLNNPIAARLDARGKGTKASAQRIAYALVCFLAIIVVSFLALARLKRTGWLGAL
jgi:hypothetical protein